MRLRVQHELVDVERLLVVAEEQVKVFQRLAEVKRLHHVPRARVGHAFHVAQRAVAVFHSGELLECLKRSFKVSRLSYLKCDRVSHLEYFPTPFLVCHVAGQVVHVPETFNGFRPE